MSSKGILSKRFKILGGLVLSGTAFTYQYKYLRDNKPEFVDKNVWAPFMKHIYPFLLKT